MAALWLIFTTLFIILFVLLQIKKQLTKTNSDLIDGINLNTKQRENAREVNINLFSKSLVELEKTLTNQLATINEYIKSQQEPKVREFEKQYYIIQKLPFLLPYEIISLNTILKSLDYRMWDETDAEKTIQQRFFIWFTKLIFEKKLNISDFNIIKKNRFDEYGMNEGYLIIFEYIKQDDYTSMFKAELKGKTTVEFQERWDDWDYHHSGDYCFKSLRGIFEEDYTLVKKINNKLSNLYFELDKSIEKDKKIMVIPFHEYLEFLSEACGVHSNLFIQSHFLNEENINFINFLEISNFDWTPDEKNKNTFKLFMASNNLDTFEKKDTIILYKNTLRSLISENDINKTNVIIKELSKLSEDGFAYASLVLGMIYLDGYKALKDPLKAKGYIEKSYNQGLTKVTKEIWNKFEMWKSS